MRAMTLCLRDICDVNGMDQDQLKKAVAKAAIDYIPDHCIVGVGTGSTANYFIDELAAIKGRIAGAEVVEGKVDAAQFAPRRLQIAHHLCAAGQQNRVEFLKERFG